MHSKSKHPGTARFVGLRLVVQTQNRSPVYGIPRFVRARTPHSETLLILVSITIGLGVGILVGFLGIGGGILLVPALTLLLGFSLQTAHGTSLFMQLPPLGHPPGEVFEYTDVMFTLVKGKKVTYVCERRGDDCPVMESGKMYTANREGNAIYVSMNSPKGKPFLVKYKELGGW